MNGPIRLAAACVGAALLELGCAPAAKQSPGAAATATSAPAQPEVWATAAESTVPPLMLMKWIPNSVHPIKELGCSFGGAAVPVCTRLDAEPFNLSRVNQLVRLRGRMVTFGGMCTQRGCSDDAPYCNRFIGTAAIDVGPYRVMLEGELPRNPTQDPWPAFYHCVGDRSAQCCGFDAMGEEILAQGTLKDINTFDNGVEQHQPNIENAHICRVAPPPPSPTNRYITDLPSTTMCP